MAPAHGIWWLNAPDSPSFSGAIRKYVPQTSSEGVNLQWSMAMMCSLDFLPSLSEYNQFSFVPPGIPSQIKTVCTHNLQFSSVAQLCLTLCDPMNLSTAGLPVHHHLPEFTQTHVHRVSDAIQPSHSLSSPSPPAPNPSQHQSLFQ